MLLTDSYSAKLADVGLAKFVRQDTTSQRMSTIANFTWQYSAPEVLNEGKLLPTNLNYRFGQCIVFRFLAVFCP